jgi:hypothetical protein
MFTSGINKTPEVDNDITTTNPTIGQLGLG